MFEFERENILRLRVCEILLISMNPGKQKNKNKKRYLPVFCNQYTPDLYIPLLCSRMGRGWGNQLLMGDGDSITHSTYMYTFFCVSVYLVRKELNVIFFNQ